MQLFTLLFAKISLVSLFLNPAIDLPQEISMSPAEAEASTTACPAWALLINNHIVASKVYTNSSGRRLRKTLHFKCRRITHTGEVVLTQIKNGRYVEDFSYGDEVAHDLYFIYAKARPQRNIGSNGYDFSIATPSGKPHIQNCGSWRISID